MNYGFRDGVEQAAQQAIGATEGFTFVLAGGSAVGVHGPARWVKWMGSLVNTFDSSDGCVGVARDAEIKTIAEWVRADSVRTIELR